MSGRKTTTTKRKRRPYNGGGLELTLEERSDWIIEVKDLRCNLMGRRGAVRGVAPSFKFLYKKLKEKHKDEWLPPKRTLERWCFVQSKEGTKGLRAGREGKAGPKCKFNSDHQTRIDAALVKDPYTTNSELALDIYVKSPVTAKK